MAICRQALFVVLALASLQTCSSMHSSADAPASRSPAEHTFLTAAHRSDGSPHSVVKSKPETRAPIIALSDLRIQRFGRKHNDEVTARVEQVPEVQSVPLRFFQIEQSHGESNASSTEGEAGGASDIKDAPPLTLQQSLEDNVTSPGTGFVADAQSAMPLLVQDNQGAESSPSAPEDLPAASATATPSDDEDWKEFTKEEALIASSLEAANEAALQETGFKSSRSFQFSVLLLVAVVIVIIGGVCLVAGFFASFIWQKQLDSPTRSLIEELPVSCASDIDTKLPYTGGYDCTFYKPLSTCELIRLEARVEGACEGFQELQAPLSAKACVLHSVQVSRQLHQGVHPIPVAFTSASVDFVVSLKEAPQVRIEIRGEDVSLFDVGSGQTCGRHAFADAPDAWQDFVLTHRAAPGNDWQTLSQVRSDNTPLEFQECALLVGSLATFVGELHRGADGTLSLRPLQLDRLSEDLLSAPCQRTWASELSERWHLRVSSEEGEQSKTHFAKVLASDDAALFTGAEEPNSLFSMASSLLRRFPVACSARALQFASTHCSARKVFQY